MFRNIFCDKKRRSPFAERNEQFKISWIYISFGRHVTFLTKLAFITDDNQLRFLNLKLRRTNQSISQLVNHVDSFRRKLQILKSHLNDNIFHFFPYCQIILEEHNNNCNLKEYIHFLNSLIDEFDTQFTCFKNSDLN